MSNRVLRVAQQIKEIVSEVIVRHLKDPGIGFVTIARVKVSRDLKEALIFVNILGTEKQKKESLTALNRASGFIQHFLGKELHIRSTPHVKFKYDTSLDHVFHIEEVLKELKAKESKDENN